MAFFTDEELAEQDRRELHAKTCQTAMCPECFPTRLPKLPTAVQVHDMTAAEAVKLTEGMNAAPTGPRELLHDMLRAALRGEYGVRKQLAKKRDTSFYAGRRAMAIADVARVLSHLYGLDYDAAKHAVGAAISALEGTLDQDLIEPSTRDAIVVTIAQHVLR